MDAVIVVSARARCSAHRRAVRGRPPAGAAVLRASSRRRHRGRRRPADTRRATPHARAQHGAGHQSHIYVHAGVLGYEKAGDMPLVRLLCRAAWRVRRTPANPQQRRGRGCTRYRLSKPLWRCCKCCKRCGRRSCMDEPCCCGCDRHHCRRLGLESCSTSRRASSSAMPSHTGCYRCVCCGCWYRTASAVAAAAAAGRAASRGAAAVTRADSPHRTTMVGAAGGAGGASSAGGGASSAAAPAPEWGGRWRCTNRRPSSRQARLSRCWSRLRG
jgi:hypothetical protein